MKFFIICVFLCLIANNLAKKHTENMTTATEECRREENISEEEYNKVIDHHFDNPTSEMKCFTACVAEKIGILKDNIVQEDVVLEIAREVNKVKMTNIILQKCKQIQSEDRCDMAFRFHVCVQNTKKEILEAEK
ncbi:general odorant-binding protein 56a-like [Lucilia sericata]|uniref:general odorant-binding protein 56a-like n=1 Tax=Lucilia sericata TaxID=13632 RepID=UPI0018A7F5CF|nr:general odorant-binding protein 56a-like [Lucilia sericata]